MVENLFKTIIVQPELLSNKRKKPLPGSKMMDKPVKRFAEKTNDVLIETLSNENIEELENPLEKYRSSIVKSQTGEKCVKLKKSKHKLRDNCKIIDSANFEIHELKKDDVSQKLIIVFSENDRSKCYEYSWVKSVKKYICLGCHSKQKRVSVEICERENGTTFVKLGPKKHVCETRDYNPEKYIFDPSRIIESPNFKIHNFQRNGVNKSFLFIFDSADKSVGYKYYWDNTLKVYRCGGCQYKSKLLSAKILKNMEGNDYVQLNKPKHKTTSAKLEEKDDGTEYIRLLSPGHVCDPKDYQPQKFAFDAKMELIEKPNFKVLYYNENGISKSMLIIFCPTNKELCYEYLWNESGKYYFCDGCKNLRHVIALYYKNNIGEDFVKLNQTEHVCDLKFFDPEKFSDETKS
uniref:Uncharacterized protein n=1 Tax=Panagrolaimus davidi TaxID=227884 RepID=A0A914QYS3_9BILA